MSVPGALSALLGALDGAGVAWTLLRPRASLAEPAGDVDGIGSVSPGQIVMGGALVVGALGAGVWVVRRRAAA